MSAEAIRLVRIHGRVQGVGYRAFVEERAARLALRGWVRNRSDGSVEALIAGARGAVDRLAAELREGPPGAQVSRICSNDAAADALAGFDEGFVILRTL